MHGSADGVKIELDMAAPGAERFIGAEFKVEVIARDIDFGEGPVWDRRQKLLFFTDICGDTVWKWKPDGSLSSILKPSAHANGMTLDLEGRLVVAGWGGRTVFRFEKDGSITTLMSHWEGKKLNSPNDIVVHSDGSIWFTDPPGGLLNVGMVGDDLQKYLDVQPVFRISADGKEQTLVTDDFVYPNGLCFSPDEKLLYVNCSRERLIRVYDVQVRRQRRERPPLLPVHRHRARRARRHEVRRRRPRLLHRARRHLGARPGRKRGRAPEDAGSPSDQFRVRRRRLAHALHHVHRFGGRACG